MPIISFCQAGCADAQQNPPRRTRSEPAAQNAVRTRRAERGQNPPPLRLLAQDPTPRSSAQRKERASALPGLTLFARPVSTRSSALALGKSRRRLRGGRFAVAQNANRTRRAERARVGSPRFRPPSHLRGVRRRVKSRSPRLRGERCCRTGHRYPTTRPHPGSRSPLPNQTARKELVASAKVGRGSVRNARQITDPGQTKPVRRGSALAPKEARGGRCSRFAQAKQSPGQQSTFPGGFARVPFHPHAKQSPRLRGGRHLRCGSPFTCCDKAVTEAGHKSWSQRGHSIKVVNTC